MYNAVRRAGERGELVGRVDQRGQLEAGLVLMRFYFLTHDGPVPDEVIVEMIDEVVPAAAGGRVPEGLNLRLRPAKTAQAGTPTPDNSGLIGGGRAVAIASRSA